MTNIAEGLLILNLTNDASHRDHVEISRKGVSDFSIAFHYKFFFISCTVNSEIRKKADSWGMNPTFWGKGKKSKHKLMMTIIRPTLLLLFFQSIHAKAGFRYHCNTRVL